MNALEIKDLDKTFGSETKALNGASLTVKQGQIGALIGPSGSGKTTLLRAISGLEVPDAGTISIMGRKVLGPTTFIDPSERNISFLFQDYALFPHKTAEENVLFGLRSQSKHVAKERVEKYMGLCSVLDLKNRYPHQMSGGQQQRVALARALANEPDLLLLDEPFSNVDSSLKARIRLDMAALIKQCNTTAIIVVHDIEDAFAIADHLAILDEGRILQTGTAEELYHRPQTTEVGRITGACNLMSAICSASGFETSVGHIDAKHGLAEGTSGFLVYRPEDLAVAPGNAWTVDDVRFAGTHYEVTCFAGLQSLHIRMSDAKNLPAKGDKIGVSILRKEAHFVKS